MVRCAGELLGLNHKTSTNYFHRLREIIAYELELASYEMFSGETEVKECEWRFNHSSFKSQKKYNEQDNAYNGVACEWDNGLESI